MNSNGFTAPWVVEFSLWLTPEHGCFIRSFTLTWIFATESNFSQKPNWRQAIYFFVWNLNYSRNCSNLIFTQLGQIVTNRWLQHSAKHSFLKKWISFRSTFTCVRKCGDSKRLPFFIHQSIFKRKADLPKAILNSLSCLTTF